MEIELWNGQTKAIIDPVGAWLTNLSDEDGDILFPKRLFKTAEGASKLRGGSHVCLPNFGPGGASGQPQHGFGRETQWEVIDKTETSVLLRRDGGSDGYESLSSVLTYQLEDRGAIMTLETTNDGEEPLRIAPGFHPYFATNGSEVSLGGEKQQLDELAEAQFMEKGTYTLEIAGRTLTLESENLPVWVKWTDQLGPYMCVEPSLGGFAFLNAEPADDELLPSGETRTFTMTIRW